MKDGYIRVAAGSFETSIANVKNNSENICNLINEAYHNDARVLVLPELCLTGYTCEDLFNQDRLLNEAKQQLQTIITATNNKDLITIVGLPYQHLNSLYNVAAVIHQGALLALVPKTHIPNYQEFYEARRFEQAPKENTLTNFNGQKIPFGLDSGFPRRGCALGRGARRDLTSSSFPVSRCGAPRISVTSVPLVPPFARSASLRAGRVEDGKGG